MPIKEETTTTTRLYGDYPPGEVSNFLMTRGWHTTPEGWAAPPGDFCAADRFIWTEALAYEMFKVLFLLQEKPNGNDQRARI